MARKVYPKFAEKLLSWAINANAPAGLDFYFIVVDSSYIYDDSHTSLAAVGGGSIIVPETALAGVTITNGVVDATDVTLTGLTIGQTFDATIVYMKDGLGSSYLAAYLDESDDGSVPQTLGSTEGVIRWSDFGIFQV